MHNTIVDKLYSLFERRENKKYSHINVVVFFFTAKRRSPENVILLYATTVVLEILDTSRRKIALPLSHRVLYTRDGEKM